MTTFDMPDEEKRRGAADELVRLGFQVGLPPGPSRRVFRLGVEHDPEAFTSVLQVALHHDPGARMT
ncbi:MAG: hypothetical protein ACRDP4_12005, partial [Nocardioidaceae bacterium]